MRIRFKFKYHRVFKPDWRDILIGLGLIALLYLATVARGGELW